MHLRSIAVKLEACPLTLSTMRRLYSRAQSNVEEPVRMFRRDCSRFE